MLYSILTCRKARNVKNRIEEHSRVHNSTVFRKRKNSMESKKHTLVHKTAMNEADEMYSREKRSTFVS